MLFVLAVGSVANLQAGCSSCDKTTVVEVSSTSNKLSSSSDAFKDRMNELEDCIQSVRDNALGKPKASSHKELNAIRAKIDNFAAHSYRAESDKLNMHAKHIRTLRNKLKKAQKYVNENGIN